MLKRYFVCMLAAAAIGLAGCTATPPATSGTGAATGTAGGTGPPPAAPPAASSTATQAAGLTVGTTEGPYYITGTRELADGELNHTSLPGEAVRVVGHVYGGTGTGKPITGAKVEIWQADTSGAYHPPSNGAASSYPADQLALRGYVLTDKDGRYSFTTIYPGCYPGRTRHIHVRASAPGYGGVVTQLIVQSKPGDGTTPATDMIARSLPKTNFLTFSPDDPPFATFDFHLGSD